LFTGPCIPAAAAPAQSQLSELSQRPLLAQREGERECVRREFSNGKELKLFIIHIVLLFPSVCEEGGGEEMEQNGDAWDVGF